LWNVFKNTFIAVILCTEEIISVIGRILLFLLTFRLPGFEILNYPLRGGSHQATKK